MPSDTTCAPPLAPTSALEDAILAPLRPARGGLAVLAWLRRRFRARRTRRQLRDLDPRMLRDIGLDAGRHEPALPPSHFGVLDGRPNHWLL